MVLEEDPNHNLNLFFYLSIFLFDFRKAPKRAPNGSDRVGLKPTTRRRQKVADPRY